MIESILKSTICLAVLYAFYYFFLENKKMHTFNRAYLLGALLFSILIPQNLFHIEARFFTPIAPFAQSSGTTLLDNRLQQYFTILYFLIALLFLARFVYQIWPIAKRIIKNERVRLQYATLVLIDEKILPHSFLNFIFINRDDYLTRKIEPELFTHELSHVKQKHSFDILLVEFFQIVFWINPVLILVKKAIRLNHEFIADEGVIKTHQNIAGYQQILLSIASWGNKRSLSSKINYSLTKQRFLMMARRNKTASLLFAKIAILPLFFALVILFSNFENTSSEEHQNENLSEWFRHDGVYDEASSEHASWEGHDNEKGEKGHED
jgi:bla regulator protein blaR1